MRAVADEGEAWTAAAAEEDEEEDEEEEEEEEVLANPTSEISASYSCPPPCAPPKLPGIGLSVPLTAAGVGSLSALLAAPPPSSSPPSLSTCTLTTLCFLSSTASIISFRSFWQLRVM